MRYPSAPEVGVGALVMQGNSVLLVRRSNAPGSGKWSLPGGHLELGETVYGAAQRELEEETGVIGDPRGIANVAELLVRDGAGRLSFHYVLIDVLVEPRSNLEAASAGSDASDVALVNVDEALRMDLTGSARGLLRRIASGGIQLMAVETWSESEDMPSHVDGIRP